MAHPSTTSGNPSHFSHPAAIVPLTPPPRPPFCRLDVEAENLWGSHGDNVRFISHLVDAARARGVNVGIYSSQYEVG